MIINKNMFTISGFKAIWLALDHSASALLRSYSAYPAQISNLHDDGMSWAGVNHIVVTPDFPVPIKLESASYNPLSFDASSDLSKPKLYRTRAVKRPVSPEPLDSCGCIHNCVDKISETEKLEIFNNFWSLRDRQHQRDYLVKRVKFQEPKKSLVTDSRKKFSLTYTLEHKHKIYHVCRKFFLNTLNVTEKLIRYALLNKDRDLNLQYPEEACFNTTPRGGTVIVHEGYRFSRHHVTDSKTRWHCATHKAKGCRAYIYTVDTQIIRISNDHNHGLPKTTI